jgi:hypothetical protein
MNTLEVVRQRGDLIRLHKVQNGYESVELKNGIQLLSQIEK